MKFVPFRKPLSACLSIAGMATLSYIAGAVVMFFQLPPSGLLGKALVGADAWYDGSQPASRPAQPSRTEPVLRPVIDRRAETFDGFTLYACSARYPYQDLATQAFLIDMRREVVHRWSIPFSQVFPVPSHLRSRLPDSFACFFDCHLYSNGDLLVVFHSKTIAGCGLAKLDKDSKVLWSYPAAVHHDVDVAEDGTIYAIQREVVDEAPNRLEGIKPPWIVDYLVMLSPEGKRVRQAIPILAAFQDTPYSAHLATLEVPTRQNAPPSGSTAPHVDYQLLSDDPLHTNCVRVLRSDLAPKFPKFKAGCVLVSLRNLNVIAMLDPQSGKVVWAARGPWCAQHDAQFLDNGHLLLFDNLGTAKGSRVLEYDPQTQAIPWSYSGEGDAPFYTSERGMCQRLPNGNTLVVCSENGELIEVTQDKKVAWSCSLGGYVTVARRYSAAQLSFLDGGQRARP